MKILIYTGDYFDSESNVNKHVSGAAYAVCDIANALADQGNDVHVYSENYIGEKKLNCKVYMEARAYWLFMRYFRLFLIPIVFKMLFSRQKIGIRHRLIWITKIIQTGYIIHLLIKYSPDIFHLQGDLYAALLAAAKVQTKSIITIHGQNAYLGDIDCPLPKFSNNYCYYQKYNRNFFTLAVKNQWRLTTVSSGLKQDIIVYNKENYHDNISVVLNGFEKNILKKTFYINIRNKYQFKKTDKIIIVSGAISKRKNQIQVVRAYSLLDDSIKREMKVLIAGSDKVSDGTINEAIKELHLENNIILCGVIPRHELCYYYEQSDYCVVASLYETFGLPIIEAFSFGLPVICFSDMSVLDDVYNKECMILAKERSDIALSEAIMNALNTKWDKDYIMNWSQKFSLEKMAKAYMEAYKFAKPLNNFKDIVRLIS
jgi:glycosyltransferase involved in cell wall biosynthesis